MSGLRRLAPLLVLLVWLVGGCVALPDDGPVVPAPWEVGEEDPGGPNYLPQRPQPGESATDIVNHFMEAMTATPSRLGIAREFLAEDARAAWNPEREIITYGSAGTPRLRGWNTVVRPLIDASRLDSRGSWRGSLGTPRSTLSFAMVREGGEWRIANPPDALIVPELWFERQFTQAALYFFDPTARILVPEPVFVPRGAQMATSLVRGLLLGPRPELAGVEVSFLPDQDSSLGLPVTVGDQGVATILLGDRVSLSPEELQLAVAQLAWTLRQDPEIDTIRLEAGGELLALPGGVSEFEVDLGTEYDPTVLAASRTLYGIRDGLLVAGDAGELSPVSGPMGREPAGIGQVAISLDGSRTAAVSTDGRTLIRAVTYGDSQLRAVYFAAGRLVDPAWDQSGRVWLIDRLGTAARIVLVSGRRSREIQVPGVTGKDVRRLLVSRDGSRLVTVVRTRRGDRVLVNRIVRDDLGRVVQVLGSVRISDRGSDSRIHDISWRTATSIAVLSSLTPELVQIRTLSLDAAPATVETATRARRFRWLAGSPALSQHLFVSSSGTVFDLDDPTRLEIENKVDPATLTYVG